MARTIWLWDKADWPSMRQDMENTDWRPFWWEMQMPSHALSPPGFLPSNNSTLDDSGLVPPSLPPSDYFMPLVRILLNDVFHVLAGLNSREAFGPDGIPPILRNCASVLASCLAKLFQLCLSTLTFLLAGSLPTFSFSLKIPPHIFTVIFSLFKVFESISNRKLLKHPSLHNQPIIRCSCGRDAIPGYTATHNYSTPV